MSLSNIKFSLYFWSFFFASYFICALVTLLSFGVSFGDKLIPQNILGILGGSLLISVIRLLSLSLYGEKIRLFKSVSLSGLIGGLIDAVFFGIMLFILFLLEYFNFSSWAWHLFAIATCILFGMGNQWMKYVISCTGQANCPPSEDPKPESEKRPDQDAR